jgi:Domain of Unknown Function (DUF1080)
MKKLALICISALAILACNQEAKEEEKAATDTSSTTTVAEPVAASNTLTDAEKAEGWVLLFDGQSKNGWHVWQAKTDGSSWKVADGNLYFDTTGKQENKTQGGDLVSDSAFENYHLSLEWKISPNGNSGVVFGVKDDKKYEHTWHTGMEMQVLDNDGHPDGKITKHRAGNLYDLVASSSEPVKPVGEWNKAEVKWVNGKLDLFLNGENVVSTQTGDDNWKKMVAGSKFKEMKDFGKFTSGKIALQDHGDPVWYRNIKIRKL